MKIQYFNNIDDYPKRTPMAPIKNMLKMVTDADEGITTFRKKTLYMTRQTRKFFKRVSNKSRRRNWTKNYTYGVVGHGKWWD